MDPIIASAERRKHSHPALGGGYASLRLMFLFPFTLLVPTAMEFFTESNGTNLADAFARGGHALFSADRGILFWISLALFNLGIFWFIKPLSSFWCKESSCAPATLKNAKKAMERLNKLGPFLMFISIVFYEATTLMPRSAEANQAEFFVLPWVYMAMEAATTGLMVGVILWVSVENILFVARRNLVVAFPEMVPKKSSLYAKVFLIITTVVFFMVFQVFATSGYFYRKGMGLQGMPPAPLPPGGASAMTALLQSRNAAELQSTLEVFYLRTGAFMVFVLQLLWEVKKLITRPLEIIKGRLSALNSEGVKENREIQVIQNDEFAQVYGEINTLIRRQQAELALSRGQLDSITESAADPILVYDDQGVVRLFNPAAAAYFKCPVERALGSKVTDLVALDQPELLQDDAESHRQGMHLVRMKAISSTGEELRFEANASMIEYPDHREYTVVLRDIKAQLELEAGLERARHAAETSNRMKSEFLATMSHELRTPLNAVLGFSQLLSTDKNLTPAQLEKISTINRSGEHLLALINDILDISKIEAGKIELHSTVFDLVQFIKDIQEMFELKCRKKNLTLYVENVGDLPRYVEGDLGKLRQVVINLVGNAVKFTQEGGVGIAVGRDGAAGGVPGGDGGGDLFRFSVTDSGRGIPKEELDLILEPFVQSSLTDNEGGTGLGLAISSRFIAMMGGTLEIRSEVGKGSVFAFTARLGETDQRPQAEREEAVPVAVKEGYAAPILIVDDKTTNRLVLKEMLEAVGFVTMEAENGKEALERALEYLPQVVLMDIRMPVMDGYEAVKLIKGEPRLAAAKVFALTASAFRHDEERMLAAGFDGFLAKPFKRNALFALLRDKTDVQLVYETAAPEPNTTVDPDSLDYGELAAFLGPEALERLEQWIMINDFGALGAFAETLKENRPDFAALLSRCASAFDEETLGRIAADLRSSYGKA